ncbi:MAG: acyl-CoA dehydrogenase family protein [Myxococcota bacterium]|jgi:alkylation response protein AidB-like acyl-CoA dehydrogenase|nr:acyl-CoA dehydrogenase family protein [Myxococcota bacterium]
MDFSFTEDQQAVRDLAVQIFSDCCTHERSKELEDEGAWFDEALWAELANSNLTSIAVPEELGGSGMGLVELALLLQEVGRYCAPVPLLETGVLGALTLTRHGNEAQRKQWLVPVVDDAAVLTAALEEEGCSDPARPKLRAVADGDGWRLDGSKSRVVAAGKAHGILVPARFEDGRVGLFVVSPEAEGLEISEQRSITWQIQGQLDFTSVRVERDALVGDESSGEAIVREMADVARLGAAAQMLGVGEEALQRTAAYLTERKQFGRQLGSFQAVQMRCADAYIDLEGMRSTLWQAVWRVSEGLRAGAEVHAAKWWAARAGDRVLHSVQHLHGGIGSDIDYPIHRYFLWSQQLMSQFGGGSQQLAALGALLVSDDERPRL